MRLFGDALFHFYAYASFWMIRAEQARTIPAPLHLKGILLGNRSLKGFVCVCVFFVPPPPSPSPCHMCNKMSEVRLSNASPTLERVDARPPDAVRPPVRRNLFGSPDREELRRYLAASVQEDVQHFTEEYNFDPVNDTPLTPRRYEWQEDEDAAEFYRRAPHGSQRARREEDLPGESGGRDAGESARRPGRREDTDGSRKRRSGAPGDLPPHLTPIYFFFCLFPNAKEE